MAEDIVGQTIGPYQIISKLDMGSMAGVYQAYQADLDRHAALKVLKPVNSKDSTFAERFLQEARIVSHLEHPHIVPVYDYGEDQGYLYIAMRLVKGGTLDERIHGQPFALGNIRRIISHIGDALDYAHSEGVVHRDIKPKNILLDIRDNALLTDFGIAKDLDSNAKLTRLGRTLGTPNYMSPEQIRGTVLDGRSDIYALGVVLYQMATGYLPFDKDSINNIALQHLHDPVPPPRQKNPNVRPALEEVILTMLQKKPDDRYPTAGDMVRALEIATREKSTSSFSADDTSTHLSLSVSPKSDSTSSTTELHRKDRTPTSLSAVERSPTTRVTGLSQDGLDFNDDDEGTRELDLPAEAKISSQPSKKIKPTKRKSGPQRTKKRVPTEAQPAPQRIKKRWIILVGVMTLLIFILGLLVIGLALLPPFFSAPSLTDLPDNFTAKTLILTDDFSSTTMVEENDAEMQFAYENGQYIITIKDQDLMEFSAIAGQYVNFIVEVDITPLTVSPTDTYGLILRDQGDRYYVFDIDNTGQIEFAKVIDDDYITLFGRQSNAIKIDGPNTLRVECFGPDFLFFVNSIAVGRARDPDFGWQEGKIGFMVSSLDSGAKVAFDNLKIWTVAP